jgi:twitching motility two-component system response regulator PilH
MTIKKILCVDDSYVDLVNIQKIVTSTGRFVVTAGNGREAIEKAKSEKPDLIFMDVNMPDMDGFAATRALKKDPTTKDIPVVFVTSKDQKADKMWGQMQGGSGYVVKPYTSDDIVSLVNSL